MLLRCICYNWWPDISTLLLTEVHSLREALFSVTRSMDSDRCIMSHTHHCSIERNSFAALNVLCAPPVHPSPHPQRLAITDVFTVSMVLPFPEHHRVGIVEYMAFPDWLLSLSNMHWRFRHVFLCFDSPFLFISDNIPLPGCTTVYISIQPSEDISVAFEFWQLSIKLL